MHAAVLQSTSPLSPPVHGADHWSIDVLFDDVTDGGPIGDLLDVVADLLEFELDAAPVERLFQGESEGLHRFTACTCVCAGIPSKRAANCTRGDLGGRRII